MAAAADKRADLDLQISLLAEHEITKLVWMVSELAKRMGVEMPPDEELEHMKQDVQPEAVLDEIESERRYCRPSSARIEPSPSSSLVRRAVGYAAIYCALV
jgi:uncharacterized membrane protein